MEEEKEIILRSEEVSEILTTPPHWLFRWGITIVFIVIILGFLVSYFVKYPDTLTGRATITASNQVVNIVSKSSGKLTHLLVHNEQTVKENEVLGVIENAANYKDVLALSTQLDDIKNKLKSAIALPTFNFNDSILLGDITSNYISFQKSYKDYQLFLQLNPQQQQISLLEKELANYTYLQEKTEQQGSITAEGFKLSESDFKRDESLFEQKAISMREFENKKKEYLAAKSNLESQKINLTNIKININNIEKNKLQLQIEYEQQVNRFKNDLTQTLENLQSFIHNWKLKYMLISPISGKVSFFNYWSVNQNIKAGDQIFSVIPTTRQDFFARVILPTFNSGKVKIDQDVNIKLDNYPYTEYGIVRGKVRNISLVPANNTYAIDVALNKGLTTTYHKKLEYKEEMTGTADVITENLSLLDRLFLKFKKIVTK